MEEPSRCKAAAHSHEVCPAPAPAPASSSLRAEKDMATASAYQPPGKLLSGTKLPGAVQEGACGKSHSLGRSSSPSAWYPRKLI